MSKKKDNKDHPEEMMDEADPLAVQRSLPKLKRKEFDKELEKLQIELVKMQEWVKASGAIICVLFEGRDTAGKGGVIKRVTERVSPRVFRVVALSAPTEREKSQMYLGFFRDPQFFRNLTHCEGLGGLLTALREHLNQTASVSC